MSTPLSTPIRQVKLGISSTKSLPLANEYKKLLGDQHHRLWLKHQQDLDLIDDIRSYVKSRLNIEREYTTALVKLSKQHASHISKKFTLLQQCDISNTNERGIEDAKKGEGGQLLSESEASDSRLQKRLANNGLDEPEKACTLYKVWSEHINRLQATSKNRSDQFEQLIMVVDKLKDIRSHKAIIGKKCLDSHLKRIHEDIIVSMVDVEKARKLYYEDESQAKKARENEEKIKKKRSGLLTKFTDLQAKKEKTSAQREANDIQSTQARNDYIMALAAANAHLQHYYLKDLTDFIHMVDDGVLDHCKIFMATLSECDINSLKDALTNSQYWSKMINLTGSQKTNSIFLDCEQSACLKSNFNLAFEPCNNDPIQSISLEHNADYALQHEIDKWFTWFKKECRNLSQLMHQLEKCQKALSEGKKSIEMNGQTIEDLEPKIIELKQQIRKSEAAKLKAQARLRVIKEGGMQIEEWSAVESEIQADMARVQEEIECNRVRELTRTSPNECVRKELDVIEQTSAEEAYKQMDQVQLQISKDSDDSEMGESMHNLASVSRSTSNLMEKQQKALSGYSALTDPSLVWQDDFSNAWNKSPQGGFVDTTPNKSTLKSQPDNSSQYNHLETSKAQNGQHKQNANTVQSSSPLSAIMDGAQLSTSPYQVMGEAYKSDYECDYSRSGHLMRSTASSAEPYSGQFKLTEMNTKVVNQFESFHGRTDSDQPTISEQEDTETVVERDAVIDMLGRRVIAQYTFDKTNEDDLSFVEGDILHVIEISDSNWLKARNEDTGEEGFIPAPYVKLIEDEEESNEPAVGVVKNNDVVELDTYKEEEVQPTLCKALYDYQPEANTFEDDGLPHLALSQGELLVILDQGEDDGWWLVQKDNGIKGHVPSMLVEELDEENVQEDADDEEVSQYSDFGTSEAPPISMPPPEPPTLPDQVVEEKSVKVAPQSGSSLVPTSFIIIEPTPEVESRSIDTSATNHESSVKVDDESTERQVVQSLDDRPPCTISYSVVNKDFVLEDLERKPSQLAEELQENSNEEIEDSESIHEIEGDMPIPPSVVIQSFEVDKHDSTSSSEEADCENSDYESQNPQNTFKQREIKHTGNVDVNPILRHRAEEFAKQIIAEAIAMTPDRDRLTDLDESAYEDGN